LLAGEVLLFGGDADAGEASQQINPLIQLDQRYDNYVTEIRDGWSNTDLAQMAETYYEFPVSPDMAQNGVTAFTYKGMYKTLVRFKNNVEAKLMRGDLQNNTAIDSNSQGSVGIIPKVVADGETVGYTPGTLDIAKLHEITRIMDVNGCAKQSAWLSDIFQRQDFSDGIFAAYPAGAFVYGQGEKSKEASVAYGFQEGTVGNGIRVWQYGGGSPNPTDGTMTNQIAMITYRGTRVCAANQFIIVQGS